MGKTPVFILFYGNKGITLLKKPEGAVMSIEQAIEYRNSLRNRGPLDSNLENFIEKYQSFVGCNTVFRSVDPEDSRLKFFNMKERTARNKVSPDTNRKEENQCRELYLNYNVSSRNLLRIDGYGQYIIDYQTPLQRVGENNHWGCIDLLGLVLNSPIKKLCFWEVKYGQNVDSIFYGLFELLIYVAQFDILRRKEARQNWNNLLVEATLIRNIGDGNSVDLIDRDVPSEPNIRPVLFLAGNEEYFSYHNWNVETRRREYLELKAIIEGKLGFYCEYVLLPESLDGNSNPFRILGDENL